MTRPDASSPSPDKHPDDDALSEANPVVPDESDVLAAEPEPEPWTEERAAEWNAYYDLYVVGAVLLLAFIASAVRTQHPPLWSHLKLGREILAQGTPLLSDTFSYTESGRSWVNVPWLFQTGYAALYNLVYGLVPEAPDDPTANRASAEQIATGALVALTALVRLATAFILLRIRHAGPGLWWSAVCTGLALGAVIGPAGLMLGGVAQAALVSPSTWGVLFLALESLLLFRAFGQNRTGALYALPVLFLVWANVDESFLFGLGILAAAVLGWILDQRSLKTSTASVPRSTVGLGEEPSIPASIGLAGGVLLACALIVLVNPSHVKVYPTALAPITSFFSGDDAPVTLDELSYFGKTIRTLYPNAWQLLTVFYLAVVGFGGATFALNAAGFRWTRFLPFAFAAVAWGVYMRFSAEFAVLLAAVATLNGQEWFQRKFGVRGRVESAWTAWSTGGRLVTLTAFFACVSLAITGYGKTPGDARFGFGFDPDAFAFRASEFLLSRDDLKGNVFNWTPSQGDALIWKAGPRRKTYVDSRTHLYPDSLRAQHRSLLNALRDDEESVWRPAFDEYGITVVMIDADSARNTYRRLSQSSNWIPFYDDGAVVMFGRADAVEPDLALFQENRLDPDLRAFKTTMLVPAADRPPTPVNFIDYIFSGRLLTPPRASTNAALRWLSGETTSEGAASPPDPARCLLAIREARTALAQNPDDYTAYRILAVAYRTLAQYEAAILSGIEPTPENQAKIDAVRPGGALMSERLRQIVTALNYALQTTPPPRTQNERRDTLVLRYELFEYYSQLGFVDLARDQLKALLDLAKPGDITEDIRRQYQLQLDQIRRQVAQIEEAMSNLQIEQQAGPLDLAQFALNQGATGLAILQLEDADRGNMSPLIVKPQLLDLYCGTGQPERALEILSTASVDDSNLGESGLSTYRQGLVYKLLGNYQSAISLWQSRSIPRLAYERTSRALGLAPRMLRGELMPVANEGLSLPSLLEREANWEFDLAQSLLEAGEPEMAAEHYTKALELIPDLALRPLIAYYLEQIGKPVPPPKPEAPAPAAKPKREVPEIPGYDPNAADEQAKP